MTARRSCLSVPGSSPRMLAKAAGLAADELVIDLEDAVATPAKDEARAAVATLLASPEALPGRQVAVRVNGLDTPWCHKDVVAAAEHADALVIPKCERAADVEWVARLLDMLGVPTRLEALIETAAGLTRAAEIAGASDRLDGVILGYADLRASLGRPVGAAETPAGWAFAQETLLAAARAAGIQAIDGPFLKLDDPEGLQEWTAHVRALGFDGKWAIHPKQVATLDAAFSPTQAELEQARAVLDALATLESGALAVGGEMVDEATRKQAAQIVARAEAAAA